MDENHRLEWTLDSEYAGQELNPSPSKEQPGMAKAAFVLGIIACSCNVLLITSAFGFILGILAFIFGLLTKTHSKGRAGLILSLFSFLALAVWAVTYLVIHQLDPFFSVSVK